MAARGPEELWLGGVTVLVLHASLPARSQDNSKGTFVLFNGMDTGQREWQVL